MIFKHFHLAARPHRREEAMRKSLTRALFPTLSSFPISFENTTQVQFLGKKKKLSQRIVIKASILSIATSQRVQDRRVTGRRADLTWAPLLIQQTGCQTSPAGRTGRTGREASRPGARCEAEAVQEQSLENTAAGVATDGHGLPSVTSPTVTSGSLLPRPSHR